jgi:hypothetical protein
MLRCLLFVLLLLLLLLLATGCQYLHVPPTPHRTLAAHVPDYLLLLLLPLHLLLLLPQVLKLQKAKEKSSK